MVLQAPPSRSGRGGGGFWSPPTPIVEEWALGSPALLSVWAILAPTLRLLPMCDVDWGGERGGQPSASLSSCLAGHHSSCDSGPTPSSALQRAGPVKTTGPKA